MPSVSAFNKDIERNSGYIYTTNARLSSYLANQRMTLSTLSATDFRGKRVIDIGCGDGVFTVQLYDRGKPAEIVAVDPAEQAISVAKVKAGGRNIAFAVESAYTLPYPADSFDVAYMRGVLHHMDQPVRALREALRVARLVVVIEPNGYNPVLKLLERFSRYHVEHNEKSYPPYRLDRAVRRLGGSVIWRQWVGLVPMFCHDPVARLLKRIEPLVERLPVVNMLVCAQYVFVARRSY